MAEKSQAAAAASMCLVSAMDRLWYHCVVLFAEPASTVSIKSPDESISEDNSKPLVSADKERLANPTEDDHQELRKEAPETDSRRTRLSHATKRNRSKSHSPKTGKNSKSVAADRHLSSAKKFEKAVSCKTAGDWELEEVRGLIDLGFRFRKSHISPEIISVVPGLQRFNKVLAISASRKTFQLTEDLGVVAKENNENRDKEFSTPTVRPNLSEAWLIKRPDSPLLNMKVHRGYAAADMKKHIKFWARTVASEIQQES